MSLLLKKIQSYKENVFQNHESHYQSLKSGQEPHTLLVTCSDSRICPQEFSQTQGGELFIIRNAGNLIPPYDPAHPSNEALTLEYGISVLGIPEIVVCGHASCGAMGGLKDLEHIKSLPLVHKALENYRQTHAAEVEGQSLEELISWNVTTQLKALFTYPFVREGLQNGSLKVFGMVYDFTTAEVTFNTQLNETGECSQ